MNFSLPTPRFKILSMKREQVRPSGEVANDERILERTVSKCRVSPIPIQFLTDANERP